MGCGLSLLKDRFAGWHKPGIGMGQKLVEVLVQHFTEQRQSPDDAAVNLHQMSSPDTLFPLVCGSRRF
jgi:hypothetical protein